MAKKGIDEHLYKLFYSTLLDLQSTEGVCMILDAFRDAGSEKQKEEVDARVKEKEILDKKMKELEERNRDLSKSKSRDSSNSKLF
jgi:hypothetical protein